MLNLYFIHAKDRWDTETNFDWHVVARSPKHAEQLWCEMMGDGMEGAVPDRISLVLPGVSGPARIIDWYPLEQTRFYSYVDDEPMKFGKDFDDLARAVAENFQCVAWRLRVNGAGEGLVYDRQDGCVVAAFTEGPDGFPVLCDANALQPGVVERALSTM